MRGGGIRLGRWQSMQLRGCPILCFVGRGNRSGFLQRLQGKGHRLWTDLGFAHLGRRARCRVFRRGKSNRLGRSGVCRRGRRRLYCRSRWRLANRLCGWDLRGCPSCVLLFPSPWRQVRGSLKGGSDMREAGVHRIGKVGLPGKSVVAVSFRDAVL